MTLGRQLDKSPCLLPILGFRVLPVWLAAKSSDSLAKAGAGTGKAPHLVWTELKCMWTRSRQGVQCQEQSPWRLQAGDSLTVGEPRHRASPASGYGTYTRPRTPQKNNSPLPVWFQERSQDLGNIQWQTLKQEFLS